MPPQKNTLKIVAYILGTPPKKTVVNIKPFNLYI